MQPEKLPILFRLRFFVFTNLCCWHKYSLLSTIRPSDKFIKANIIQIHKRDTELDIDEQWFRQLWDKTQKNSRNIHFIKQAKGKTIMCTYDNRKIWNMFTDKSDKIKKRDLIKDLIIVR